MDNLDLFAILETLAAFATAWGLRAVGALAVLIMGRWVAGRLGAVAREALALQGTLASFASGVMILTFRP